MTQSLQLPPRIVVPGGTIDLVKLGLLINKIQQNPVAFFSDSKNIAELSVTLSKVLVAIRDLARLSSGPFGAFADISDIINKIDSISSDFSNGNGVALTDATGILASGVSLLGDVFLLGGPLGLTPAGGCKIISAIISGVDFIPGVENIRFFADTIIPNSQLGQLNIAIFRSSSGVEITVISRVDPITGLLHYTSYSSTGQELMDVITLPDHTYMMRINGSGEHSPTSFNPLDSNQLILAFGNPVAGSTLAGYSPFTSPQLLPPIISPNIHKPLAPQQEQTNVQNGYGPSGYLPGTVAYEPAYPLGNTSFNVTAVPVVQIITFRDPLTGLVMEMRIPGTLNGDSFKPTATGVGVEARGLDSAGREVRAGGLATQIAQDIRVAGFQNITLDSLLSGMGASYVMVIMPGAVLRFTSSNGLEVVVAGNTTVITSPNQFGLVDGPSSIVQVGGVFTGYLDQNGDPFDPTGPNAEFFDDVRYLRNLLGAFLPATQAAPPPPVVEPLPPNSLLPSLSSAGFQTWLVNSVLGSNQSASVGGISAGSIEDRRAAAQQWTAALTLRFAGGVYVQPLGEGYGVYSLGGVLLGTLTLGSNGVLQLRDVVSNATLELAQSGQLVAAQPTAAAPPPSPPPPRPTTTSVYDPVANTNTITTVNAAGVTVSTVVQRIDPSDPNRQRVLGTTTSTTLPGGNGTLTVIADAAGQPIQTIRLVYNNDPGETYTVTTVTAAGTTVQHFLRDGQPYTPTSFQAAPPVNHYQGLSNFSNVGSDILGLFQAGDSESAQLRALLRLGLTLNNVAEESARAFAQANNGAVEPSIFRLPGAHQIGVALSGYNLLASIRSGRGLPIARDLISFIDLVTAAPAFTNAAGQVTAAVPGAATAAISRVANSLGIALPANQVLPFINVLLAIRNENPVGLASAAVTMYLTSAANTASALAATHTAAGATTAATAATAASTAYMSMIPIWGMIFAAMSLAGLGAPKPDGYFGVVRSDYQDLNNRGVAPTIRMQQFSARGGGQDIAQTAMTGIMNLLNGQITDRPAGVDASGKPTAAYHAPLGIVPELLPTLHINNLSQFELQWNGATVYTTDDPQDFVGAFHAFAQDNGAIVAREVADTINARLARGEGNAREAVALSTDNARYTSGPQRWVNGGSISVRNTGANTQALDALTVSLAGLHIPRHADNPVPAAGSTAANSYTTLAGANIGIAPTSQRPVVLADVDGLNNGDIYAESVQWLRSDQAVLVIDANADQNVDIRTELVQVGTNSPQANSLRWLDVNGDGVVDSRDPGFAALRLWQDINGDGQVDIYNTRTGRIYNAESKALWKQRHQNVKSSHWYVSTVHI